MAQCNDLRISPEHVTPFTFYVTPLDSSCTVVLGYNWLTHYNLLIDWVWSSITFPAKCIENPVSEQKMSIRASVSEEMEPQPNSDNHDNSNSDITEETIPTTAPKINISLVDAATYSKERGSPGTQEFCLRLVSNDILARSSSMSDSPPVDMSNVLEEYYKFMDVFNKAKANTLAQHRPYDLKLILRKIAFLCLVKYILCPKLS